MNDAYHEQTPEGGEPLAGADPTLLADPVVDALMRMIMEITAELWVERERRLALEDVLEAGGVITCKSIEHHEPDAKRAAEIRQQRDQLVNGVFKELRRLTQSA